MPAGYPRKQQGEPWNKGDGLTMQKDSVKKAWLKALILLVVIIILKLTASNSNWIENFYASSSYQHIAFLLRLITGWIPFSIGDVLYCALVAWLLVKLVQFLRRKKKWPGRSLFFLSFCRFATTLFAIYLVFLLLWGLNYYRAGISAQLQLQPVPYTVPELTALSQTLVQNVNAAKLKAMQVTAVASPKEIFTTATKAYGNAEKNFPFLHYSKQSVKATLFGRWCNYPGFLGYYNPFTGEAQVNTTVPAFTIPFTTCHEMAHQLGYASESEANFVGYLVASGSTDQQFVYAAYFDMFLYANAELFYYDSVTAKNNYKQLDTLVRKDIVAYRNFFKQYENAMEPIIDVFYDKYLKANNQAEGIESYSQVIEWLIAYKKKYGKL